VLPDDRELTVYVEEVAVQCNGALFAFSELGSVLKKLDSGLESQARDICARAFFYVHALLAHSGNLSKLLFPSPPRRRKCGLAAPAPGIKRKLGFARERGKVLRAALSVDGRSPLRSRKLRNHVEHYDERLDELFETGDAVSVADMNITTGPAILVPGVRFLRNLDVGKMVVSFEGDEVNLRALQKELQRIRTSAEACPSRKASRCPEGTA